MWTWNSDNYITPLERADAADVLDQSWNPGDLHTFIKITGLPTELYMAKYPVTNAQYERFLRPEYFADPSLWSGFSQFFCIPPYPYILDKTHNIKWLGIYNNMGWHWLQKELQDNRNWVEKDVLYPYYWRDASFGVARPSAPVVRITWWEANAYCKWLLMNWDKLEEGQHGLPKPKQLRLPTETEWTLAAGGEHPQNRYAWDAPSQATTNLDEILQRANVNESKIDRTTPVWMYPLGASPYGVMDMTGNTWEWQANFSYQEEGWLGLRGGSIASYSDKPCVSFRSSTLPGDLSNIIGFRVVAPPV